MCIAFLAAQIVIAMGAPPPSASLSISELGNARQQPSRVREIKPADYYAAISERRIFGGAGNSRSPGAGKRASKSLDALPPTGLNLRLLGTAVGTEGMSTAIIENKTSKAVKVYREGEKVAPMTILDQIQVKRVVLNRDGNREVLMLAEGEKKSSAPVSPRSQPRSVSRSRRVPGASPGTTVVERREWEDKDIYEVLGDGKVSPVWKDGRVEGLQLSNVAQNEYAKRLGLEEGDVVVSVNGVRIRSVDEAIALAGRLQRAPTRRVQVLRDGKPKTLTFSVR